MASTAHAEGWRSSQSKETKFGEHASLTLAQLTKKAFKPSNSMVTIFKEIDNEGTKVRFGSSILNYRDVSQVEAGMAAKETISAL